MLQVNKLVSQEKQGHKILESQRPQTQLQRPTNKLQVYV